MNKIIKTKLTINNLKFTIRESGEENKGSLIVFLHGFPESSLMWESTMLYFSDNGYRVVAPDQRGYSAGARPEGIENYSMDLLANDVVSLAQELGYEKFHLVAHDIGSLVGWTVAAKYPEKLLSWTSLSVPDWPAYVWALQNDPTQREKGAYVSRFQVPGESEKLISSNDYAILKKLWAGFDESEIASYLKLYSQEDMLTSVINWYRALFQIKNQVDYSVITTNTVLIWGNKDLAISRAGIERNASYMKGKYEMVELNASHWLTEFNNDEINELIYNNISGKDFG
ncbi:alpha/beta fold hydrolase [Companilactobacillus huachuanensis]|uniref:Alpha/beta fold hydrolase n=1 Tax=Companilactobacillus huachuanensis TaxID=2559914 RepID=A0ABW1RQB5_9LACO|nr:alpha/beta hydrolase [Companilactobacillus huachuanensis]